MVTANDVKELQEGISEGDSEKTTEAGVSLATTAILATVGPPGSAAIVKAGKFVGKVVGVENTQIHHTIHQKLGKHELWSKAGKTVEDRGNKMLLPNVEGAKISTTKRSIHQGRHVKPVEEGLRKQMDDVVRLGKQKGFTQKQYGEELKNIIRDERGALKSGDRALNKNARPWAKKIRDD